jgi:glycosyltransferase involved in cell wall biosynthesis
VKYSVIVPVYNRPQEVEELLESLTHQTFIDFEVILVEDGSTTTSEKVYEKYSNQLDIRYFFKPNEGPGPSRNFGFEKARGNFLVVFDSDCIIPPSYFEAVENSFRQYSLDAWGGPDRGNDNFTPVQRAMGYTMSSVLTTGGIRGAAAKDFQPRSFNMGIRREVFQKTGGFRFTRFAEDIEFSIRIKKNMFRIGLIPEAFVYHKRRTSFKQFFQQVSNFGKGRVLVGRVHPEAIRLTHWFPTFFLLGLVSMPILWVFIRPLSWIAFWSYSCYLIAIFVDSFLKTRSLFVAVLSVPSALIQLTGYGVGFLREWLKKSR